MATTRSFSDMLNDYLHYDMIWGDFVKRNWLFGKLEEKGLVDKSWHGGPLVIPFVGNIATSVEYGALTDEDDVHEFDYVRGSVDDYKEVWGTLLWHQRDIMEHDGKVKEKSFLKNLDHQYPKLIEHLKEVVSMGILNSKNITSLVSGGDSATGDIVVAHPERLHLGQKVNINDGSNSSTGYVKSIIIDTGAVQIVTTRGGSTGVDLQSPDYAGGTKIYAVGGRANGFSSLPSMLLSNSNGGDATIFGQTKTAYPFLQACNFSGSGWSASNILEKLFDTMTTARRIGRGNPTDFVMSYKHMGSIMKILEGEAGAYRHISTKASPYGYTEVEIGGVQGKMTCVAVNEKDDDTIIGLDWDTMKFHTNGGIRKVKDPDGNEYYKIRSTSGYKYLCDVGLYGELVVHTPCHNAIVHTISY